MLERWKVTLTVSNRTVAKYLVILHGIFRRAMKVWGLLGNPAASVERPRFRVSDDLEAFSPEEVWALVRAAGSEQDACLFLTAAFTGCGWASSSRWSGVTSTSLARRSECGAATTSTAGSGPPRAARSDRYRWSLTWPSTSLGSAAVRTSSSPRILVFPGALGRFQDASSVRIRYQAALARAALRPLRFHDLRRTLAVRRAEVPAVQAWMGHADIQTTMRYVHHRDRGGEGRLLAEAFATDVPIIPTLDVEA
jgi:integrase